MLLLATGCQTLPQKVHHIRHILDLNNKIHTHIDWLSDLFQIWKTKFFLKKKNKFFFENKQTESDAELCLPCFEGIGYEGKTNHSVGFLTQRWERDVTVMCRYPLWHHKGLLSGSVYSGRHILSFIFNRFLFLLLAGRPRASGSPRRFWFSRGPSKCFSTQQHHLHCTLLPCHLHMPGQHLTSVTNIST